MKDSNVSRPFWQSLALSRIQPAQVKAIIEQSADDLGKGSMDDYYGRGRVNAYKAVTR